MLILIVSSLTSCSILRVHKQDIQQGNVYTSEDTSRLHVGMSQEEVTDIMGEPVDTQLFSNNRATYVYTFQKGYGDRQETKITLTFVNGRVASIQ